jgi:hypothetical protein
MPQTPADDRRPSIERSVRLPAVSLVPSQTYFNRAILATALAVVTVAVMYGPAAGSLAPKTHEPTAQPGLHIIAPRHVEPREVHVEPLPASAPTVRNVAPAPNRGNLPAGATTANLITSVKPNPLTRRMTSHPEPPVPASVLPIPDLHRRTPELKPTPKKTYVWR